MIQIVNLHLDPFAFRAVQHNSNAYNDASSGRTEEHTDGHAGERAELAQLKRAALAHAEASALLDILADKLKLDPHEIQHFKLHRRSIDARKRNSVKLLYTVRFCLAAGEAAEKTLVEHYTSGARGDSRQKSRHKSQSKSRYNSRQSWQLSWMPQPQAPSFEKLITTQAATDKVVEPATFSSVTPILAPELSDERIVVVGAGCAGLFCALTLAHAGLKPILIERGNNAARRTLDIKHFNQTGQLDLESNIQFGVGGAGTFSDGKLATGTKSALHALITKTFIDAGAPHDISWNAHPHIGSDILPNVVDTICDQIRAHGGEIYCSTKVTELLINHGSVRGVRVIHTNPQVNGTVEKTIATSKVILASGHSARDVFKMLAQRKVFLERKTFAMGVRIEHLQQHINEAQYGRFADEAILGAAPYKLVAHLDTKRSAFSFCMCPGGYVVAATSEKNAVVTNGMSLAARAGTNANAGFLANVYPDDLPGDSPLEGLYLQRRCEQAAYERGGGSYVAPAQLVGDFMQKVASSAAGSIVPTYSRGVSWTSLEGCLPTYITDTLRKSLPLMEKRLHGFAVADAVLTGVETRSSSPIRITRDASSFQSINCKGLYPCGEGAGYAGGIMSAATDGVRVARAVIQAARA